MSTDSSKLTSMGNIALTGATSLAVNALGHPLCTLKVRRHEKIPLFTLPGIYKGVGAFCAVDAVVFATTKLTNDHFKKTLGPNGATLAASALSTPVVAFGESWMANRVVGGMPSWALMARGFRVSGLAMTFLREFPYNWMLMGLELPENKSLTAAQKAKRELAAGLAGGGLAGFLTAPIDRIKTNVQTSPMPISIWDATKKVLAEEGYRGLVKGGLYRTAHVGLCLGISRIIYSQLPKYMPKNLKAA